MAVAFDAAAASIELNGGSGVVTTTHTASGEDRAAVVSYAVNNFTVNEPSAATYNGVAMPKEVTAIHSAGANPRASIYSHLAPGLSSETISFTLPGGSYGVIAVTSYVGVNQTTPVVNSNFAVAAASPVSATCTTAADEILVDACCTDGQGTALTIGADQTLIDSHIGGGFMSASVSRQAGSDGGVMSWTGPNIGSAALAVVSLMAAPVRYDPTRADLAWPGAQQSPKHKWARKVGL